MKLYNIKYRNEEVNFSYALTTGLGKDQGLFFPKNLPKFSKFQINELLNMGFLERSTDILYKYIGPELLKDDIENCVKNAFNFSVPLIWINDNIAILELFHGPTLAFKDFGCRLMAQMLTCVQKQDTTKPMLILTATSGDTGAAVAHAFYELSNNIHVIILYPKGKISVLQEKLFCTLGSNISTIAVDGDFDICQHLVKQAFDDIFLKKEFCLNSANSINISRLLAQICYYFELIYQLPNNIRDYNNLVISVPSGNFGNLTAGLLAQFSGLPIKKFIAATNLNNTIPRFLQYGIWDPSPTINTVSNAMDVSLPSNWSRIQELFDVSKRSIRELGYGYVTDDLTKKTVQEIANLGYICDPHTAVAYCVLRNQLGLNECGICLGTAHPAKFQKLIESFLEKRTCVFLPDVLKKCMKLPTLSYHISGCFSELRHLIFKIMNT